LPVSPDDQGGAPSRRQFLAVSLSTVAIALAIPLGSAACRPTPSPLSRRPAFNEGGWLTIDTSGQVVLLVGQTELGQGIHTAMAMMVAEELGCAWEQIRVQHAPADPAFDNPLMQRQRTAWSASVRGWWKPLREAGASARMMLAGAAADRWKVDTDQCHAVEGSIVGPGGQRATFAELAAEAGQRTPPRQVALKSASAFNVIGKSRPRVDLADKTTGAATYGLDTRLPGMQYCVIARPPYAGAVGVRQDVESMPGIRIFETPFGIAFVAPTTWQALRARQQAEIRWNGGTPPTASDEFRNTLASAVFAKPVDERRDGNIERAFADSAQTIEAQYYLPYLAHVPMEPLNCTAHLNGTHCRVIVPTQDQTAAHAAAAEAAGAGVTRVTVETPFAGGGFGRRVHPDVVREAVTVARLTRVPVQVVWSREDDLRHDFYRPACLHRMRAAVDVGGNITGWSHAIAGQGLSGAADLPYPFPAMHVTQHPVEHTVPTGIWRAVDNGPNAFAVESFIDEVALATGRDSLEWRRSLLANHPRALSVLNLVAEESGWGTPTSPSTGRGVAIHGMVGSWVAIVIEVEGTVTGHLRVTRATAAIDCGTAVNPDGVRAQVEGSIAMGLSAARFEKIMISRGQVTADNLTRYRLLRINEMPAVDVHIVPSTAEPGGVGEPALPPVAPALCNAIAAFTGLRLRELPLRFSSTGA
jgi:isoquinoline 1-oxidoreductase beta subunit